MRAAGARIETWRNAMRYKKEDLGGGDELRGLTPAQEAEAEHRGLDFLTKIVRLPGVRIRRDEFLRQELAKVHAGDDIIARSLHTNPAAAGVPLASRKRQSPTKPTSRPPSPSRRASPAASRCSPRSPQT